MGRKKKTEEVAVKETKAKKSSTKTGVVLSADEIKTLQEIEKKLLKKSKKDADTAVTQKNEEISMMNTTLGEIKGALQTKRNHLEEERQKLEAKNTELTIWIDHYNYSADRIKDISMEDVINMYQSTEN